MTARSSRDVGQEIMKIKYEDIETAFDFVSSAPMCENTAVLMRDSGRIVWRSEFGGMDDVSDEDLEAEDCVEIPHKNELDLGEDLVFAFAEDALPADLDRIHQIFSRRGAYGRFKELLDSRRMLQSWYDFERTEQEKALRQWCKDNGIELTD